jgi:hypothetical protein
MLLSMSLAIVSFLVLAEYFFRCGLRAPKEEGAQ